MPDDSRESDAEIIRAAYAEKVKEAFKVFAENIGMGQNQKNSMERFTRSLELVRRARDMALQAAADAMIVEPTAQPGEQPASGGEAGASAQTAPGGLSPEEQALVDQALAGTTGQRQFARR